MVKNSVILNLHEIPKSQNNIGDVEKAFALFAFIQLENLTDENNQDFITLLPRGCIHFHYKMANLEVIEVREFIL